MTKKDILKINTLCKYFGGLKALDGVTFSLKEKEIFGVIGPNGAGKTTLFNVISGALKPSSGHMYFNDAKIDGLPQFKIAQLGIVKTHQIPRPFYNLSVFDNFKVASNNKSKEFINEVLNEVVLYDKKDNLPSNLTYHDRKKIELGRALMIEPKILLMDEVFAGLNQSEANEMLSIVRNMQDKGITIIMIEHIMRVIMSLAERMIVINFGQLIAEGAPSEIANNDEVVEAYLGKKGKEVASHC